MGLTRAAVLCVLEDAFERMGVRYFRPEEFLHVGRPAPPLPLISHILPVVSVLDRARESLGRIRITSGYRDPLYNAQVGGVPNSQHTVFTAADCVPLETSPLALYEWLDSCGYRDRLGLGIYDTFVHADCRHWPGMPKALPRHQNLPGPARWDNRSRSR